MWPTECSGAEAQYVGNAVDCLLQAGQLGEQPAQPSGCVRSSAMPAHLDAACVPLAHRSPIALHCPACRNVARQLASGELPQPPAPAKGMSPQQAAEALAVGSSHPTWLVQGWLEQYGPAATMALTKHNNM